MNSTKATSTRETQKMESKRSIKYFSSGDFQSVTKSDYRRRDEDLKVFSWCNFLALVRVLSVTSVQILRSCQWNNSMKFGQKHLIKSWLQTISCWEISTDDIIDWKQALNVLVAKLKSILYLTWLDELTSMVQDSKN